MTALLFSLQGVPADEADEVRALLHEHAIDFYETSAGNWGVSSPGLWVNNPDDLIKARQLLAHYQQQRFLQQRAIYEQQKAQGESGTFLKLLQKKPLQFLGAIAAILFMLYVSLKWLFELGLELSVNLINGQ